jgi:hypothetical protein
MSGIYFLRFLKSIFLLSPFKKFHHSLFSLSILFLTFFYSTTFQMHLRLSLHLLLGSLFPPIRSNTPNTTFLGLFFIYNLRLFKHSSCFLLLNITSAALFVVFCLLSISHLLWMYYLGTRIFVLALGRRHPF